LTYEFKQICGEVNWPAKFNFQVEYDESPLFCQTFIASHVDYHALHLGALQERVQY
jgi:S-formylglutathione hydrolase FrmB